MRIGLDARTLTLPRPRGTGRNLLDAYRLIPELRPEWEFVLYHQRPPTAVSGDEVMPWDAPNVRLRRVDIPGDRFDAWFQVRLPLAARQDHVDLLHCPANAAPAWCPAPLVVTIHDLVPLRVPDELPARETTAFRRGIERAIRRALHIITPSEATRRALHEMFGVLPKFVSVVPWAADTGIAAALEQPLSPERQNVIRSTYGLGPNWLVTFAGSTRRKNARGVLEGLSHVRADLRRDVQVILVGCEPQRYRDELTTDAERLGIVDHVRILDFVPLADLPALLRGSCGLLMPSRCEGFGLPILDAFACGVPVLTSDRSSMPEVAGEAAVYCDPDDSRSIGTGIEQLLDPAAANRLVNAGKERLSQFTWENTAQAMCAVYEQCLIQSGAARHNMVLEGCP